MNPRERFKRITSFQEADRVPVDLGSHVASIHRQTYTRLLDALNFSELKTEAQILDRMVQNVVPHEKILERYHIDFRWIAPNWVGITDVDENRYRDMWGIEWKYMLDAYAADIAPLQNATIDEIDRYDWHDPFDTAIVDGLADRAKYLYQNTEYVLVADAIKGGLLTKALQIRGYEQMMLDLIADVEFAEALLDKLLSLYKDMWTNFLRAVGPYVQMVYFTDDLGSQTSLLISPRTFRSLIKPRIASLIDHIKGLVDVKFMFHSDGAIAPLIEDIIDMGVDVLNPIQTSATGMDTAALKETYHGRLCFHGGIDVQQMLPSASPEEVGIDVAKRIGDLARGGGYMLAPCHNIGSDVPVKNIEALFDAAHEYGKYPITAVL